MLGKLSRSDGPLMLLRRVAESLHRRPRLRDSNSGGREGVTVSGGHIMFDMRRKRASHGEGA